ncbi:cardiolipin synthetase [Fusobacterium necrophorum DJ-1]|uniref:Cardiolipin synthase n=3 Tax=Fusobacterium necrophorum TaxID=859 RepID=A0AB73BU95_9FUSO|nr:cardiolipin synthase [Fusobacterium necrophorum]KDE60727.1 cardiolipin synthetase [Fusobacterium necrophorum BFTR-1]KDE61251.1 cardiolipin synthetase [Fusobacterium necrophorum BL]KDE66435.1 cardiolipin synthetase [Fusobacterium necrophorum DJ-1]KDE69154.1 cardiolipin synthetase [Fusobacterium necrophorum DJ-2]KDE70693.1 cardiolipin synthetase [Fusobacterium necrophorum DAB]
MIESILKMTSILLEYIWIMNLSFILILVLLERKNPLYTLLWTIILSLAPYIGFIAYLFFGISFRKRRKANKIYQLARLESKNMIEFSQRKDLQNWEKLIHYLEMTSKNRLTWQNTMTPYFDGQKYFRALLQDLKEAKKEIKMEMYLFRKDMLGNQVLSLLVEKARTGVEIFLLLDGANPPSFSMRKILKIAGIEYRIFFPSPFPFINISLNANYRNHKKMCIIDRKIAYIGGFNIGDEYIGNGKLGYWRDTAIRVAGEIVVELEKEFYFTWNIASREKRQLGEKVYPYMREVMQEIKRRKGRNTGYMQVATSGPNFDFHTLRDSYLNLIQGAKSHIYIQTPYFVPDDIILDALKIACLSGVKVKIMIPAKSDHFIIQPVNHYFIGELLELGADILEYQKGFLHCKVIMVDGEVVSMGSCNVDYRSFYQNFEINVNIYEKDVVGEFEKQFKRDIAASERISYQNYHSRALWKKAKEAVFRLFAPVL